MDENDGRIVFYYSREERLKKASQAVRDLNSPSVTRKPNLFRTLTATKPLTFLFISVITLCAGIIILSRFLNAEGVRVLGNNTVTVSVIVAGDNSYISVKKTAGEEGAYTGAVDIAVSLSDEGNSVFAERFYFGPEEEEFIRFSVPFKGKKLLILMEAGAERVLFKVTPG